MRTRTLGFTPASAVVAGVLVLTALMPKPAEAGGVVGTGTPGSCTEGALDDALAGGGSVTFDCGASPFTLTVTTTKTVAADTNIDGGNLVTLDGGGAVQIFIVNAGATLSLGNVTISGGRGANGSVFAGDFGVGGSAITNSGTLYVTYSTLSGNSGGDGSEGFSGFDLGTDGYPGGSAISNSGTLYVTNSTLSGNSGGDGGQGGTGVGVAGDGGWGGSAITNSGTLDVTGSTFSGNAGGWGGAGGCAVTEPPQEICGFGAGGWGGSTIANSGTLYLNNSTFSGNTGGWGGAGGIGSYLGAGSGGTGGIVAYGGALYAINSTLSGNTGGNGGPGDPAGPGGNGAILASGGTVMIENTIVANNTSPNCGGTITDGGHNLRWPSTDLSCVGDFGDPMLGSLAYNGGPTQTMALQPGSAAIDAGDNSICATGPVWNLDQRGFLRPGTGSSNCSIGAYEFNSSGLGPPTPTMTPTITPTPTSTPTPTMTLPPGLISGTGRNPCVLEWLTEPATLVGRNGLPVHKLMCTDDDPLCDFGAATGDNACTFHVALCLNVADARLSCSPTDVARVQVLSPNEAKPKDASATANRDALENALTALGGMVRGQCASRPHRGQICAVNADCDSTTGSGDGVCKGRFVVFAPPLTTGNSCTAFAPIQLPLKQTTTGLRVARATLKVKAISDPGAGQKGHNSLELTCKPHP